MDEELIQAVSQNDIDRAKAIIRRAQFTSMGLTTAIHLAAGLSGGPQPGMLGALLEASQDINSKNSDGRTVLHTVIESLHWSPRHIDSLQLFLAILYLLLLVIQFAYYLSFFSYITFAI